jgi:hypothetical protein
MPFVRAQPVETSAHRSIETLLWLCENMAMASKSTPTARRASKKAFWRTFCTPIPGPGFGYEEADDTVWANFAVYQDLCVSAAQKSLGDTCPSLSFWKKSRQRRSCSRSCSFCAIPEHALSSSAERSRWPRPALYQQHHPIQ